MMEKSQAARGVCGVGPAERTGKPRSRYCPGGMCLCSSPGFRRPRNPRETKPLLIFSLLISFLMICLINESLSYESSVRNSALSPSAGVGWVKTPSLKAVEGSLPIMATWMMVIISPPSILRIVQPRICRVSVSTMAFINPRVSPVSRARVTAVMGNFATRILRPCLLASASVMPTRPGWGSMKDGMGHQAIPRAGVAFLQQIGAHNAVVIVGDMDERWPTSHISHGVNVRHIRFQSLIDLDIALLVQVDASRFRGKRFGVGNAASGCQQMRADKLLFP